MQPFADLVFLFSFLKWVFFFRWWRRKECQWFLMKTGQSDARGAKLTWIRISSLFKMGISEFAISARWITRLGRKKKKKKKKILNSEKKILSRFNLSTTLQRISLEIGRINTKEANYIWQLMNSLLQPFTIIKSLEIIIFCSAWNSLLLICKPEQLIK